MTGRHWHNDSNLCDDFNILEPCILYSNERITIGGKYCPLHLKEELMRAILESKD